MEEAWAAGAEGGFCSGLCANTGEPEPGASVPAKRAARRDRVDSQKERLVLCVTGEMDGLCVPQRVAMIVFTPRDFCPNGTFLFRLNYLKRSNSRICFIFRARFMRSGSR
jgi:hypothetical protein